MSARGCVGLTGMPDSETIPAALVSGSHMIVTGSGYDTNPTLRHAGGKEDWLVYCLCGTYDDDGEHMISCDMCGLWMHTRCNNIPDDEADLPGFICGPCAKKNLKGH